MGSKSIFGGFGGQTKVGVHFVVLKEQATFKFGSSPHIKRRLPRPSARWAPLSETGGRTPTQPGTGREDTPSSSSSLPSGLVVPFSFYTH